MPSLIVAESAGSTWTLVFVVLVIYFVPTIVGRSRGVPNLGSVFVINLFLGWTLIGWVVALAMASRSVPDRGTATISSGAAAVRDAHAHRPAAARPGISSSRAAHWLEGWRQSRRDGRWW